MDNYGVVVYRPSDNTYLSGYGYGGNGARCAYWTPWLVTARVWKTRKGAEHNCPKDCQVRNVKVELGHAMEVIE